MAPVKRSSSPTSSTLSHDVFVDSGLRRSKRLKISTEAINDAVHDEGSSGHAGVVRKRKTIVKAEVKSEDVDSTTKLLRRGSTSPRKQKPVTKALETPHPTPIRWREAYDTIKDMRSRIVAPVDTMGCNRAQLEETLPERQRFATLVSLMLSSQTRDETTFTAVCKLREAVGGSLSVQAIMEADEGTISEAICKVGFWRRKTQYIKQAAQKLYDEFDSDVPKTVEELCSLNGVGPKMAFLALQDAWKLNAGIGVDVHVHRITNRLGWHKPETKTPEETRVNLESWLPLELHPQINSLLVGFGQTVCLPIGPRCDTCELSSGLCPSARKPKPKSKSKRERGVTVTTSQSGPKIEIALETEIKAEIADIPLLVLPESGQEDTEVEE